MLKIILQSVRSIPPFNEPARDLRIQNKPLWLYQRDVLSPYIHHELELPPGAEIPIIHEACIVYRDNLFFDTQYILEFIKLASGRREASQAAFSINDPAFIEHSLPLSISYIKENDYYLADLWYYPNGYVPDVKPLIIDTHSREIGYYHVPTYMALEQGDLVYHVPLRSLIAIDSWVHLFIADIVFGLFSHGARFEKKIGKDLFFKLGMMLTSIFEGKQVLESSKIVQIGKNCTIDPSAIIHGPTTIGDHVTIGAGAVIDNCIIGDNVNISQGCQLMLSVVGDGTFLPFRAALLMTTVMDNCLIAQNTCLQMCVIGRNTFIGSGTTFTDFNLLSLNIKARDGNGQLRNSNRPVLGGCVGHNCRLGAGLIVYPARMIESDVILLSSKDRRVIDRDISFEDSDHHQLPASALVQRYYPRPGEKVSETW